MVELVKMSHRGTSSTILEWERVKTDAAAEKKRSDDRPRRVSGKKLKEMMILKGVGGSQQY